MLVKLLQLTVKSMLNRAGTTLLTVLVIAISVTLLLGVEKVRTEARTSFANTISGTDLVVGARSGGMQLLLYSVFRIGNATNNITWESYQQVAAHPNVAWSVPISLGDSHKGFRVVGTSAAYFEHYRYGRERPLRFTAGEPFSSAYDAVLGADVAETLGYEIGREIVLAHGTGDVNLLDHRDKPFTVVGVLAKTGTPVDRSVHVSLAGIEAMHIDWHSGVPVPSQQVSAEEALTRDLTPQAITAFLVGVEPKTAIFGLQRDINDYRREPLLAVLPGVALQELWNLLGAAERALLIVSSFVVLSGLIGMLSAILSSLSERRREMAILRSVGARPWQIFMLLTTEAVLFTLIGCALGVALLYATLTALRPWIAGEYGLFIAITPPSSFDLTLLAVVIGAGVLVGLVPAYRAYRHSLADGLTVRV